MSPYYVNGLATLSIFFLQKVDLSDLEELCASELTGMSKTRISSIINGKEMLESSNTDDTDDSGIFYCTYL